jgi:hypothetical protein
MNYRIKKVESKGINGNISVTYYPQHKHWWSGWHYFGYSDEWSDHKMFDTLEKAIEWLKLETCKKCKVEYIYFNDEYEFIV